MEFTFVMACWFRRCPACGFGLTASFRTSLSVVNRLIRPEGLSPSWLPASPAHTYNRQLNCRNLRNGPPLLTNLGSVLTPIGCKTYGNENGMVEAEKRNHPYLFKLSFVERLDSGPIYEFIVLVTNDALPISEPVGSNCGAVEH